MRRGRAAAVLAASAALLISGCSADGAPHGQLTASVAEKNTAVGVSDGDLWPSCWSDDDALYAANGDGAGFGSKTSDIVMNRITGTPASGDLAGEALAYGDQLGQVWSGGDFTRKPTGMLCVGGILYLAVQDLRHDFNAAPAATIARSDDHGATWMWDARAPMFSGGVFTTVFFLDYGKDAADAPDAAYAYAYGLDGNWRDSFDDSVADPTELFLARVPVASVQDASTWEYYAGEPGDDEPTWTDDIAQKRPVLIDERRAHELSLVSQGGVTYLPKLDRYVYTSWSEYTFEFHQAPAPWGPWTPLLSEDFGVYPWTDARHGGYATTLPSKYLSADNRTGWVQSNVCPCAPAGMTSYWFGLRELQLEPKG
ncbi:MAG: hypothetical protein DI566_12580 [Microbacterium sp.]|nr:MAG: hypothetical protein DI566_12580 [Microbacterium sp.]